MAHIFTSAGDHIIRFTAGIFTTSYTFPVTGLELLELRMVEPPTQLSYAVGDEFNPTGMKLMGTYNTGDIEEVTHYEVQGFDSSTATDCCTVTITCGNCSCVVDVTVLPSLYEYVENDTGISLVRYYGYDTNVVISSKIDGYTVTAIEATCFSNSNIISVVIPDTVTSIE